MHVASVNHVIVFSINSINYVHNYVEYKQSILHSPFLDMALVHKSKSPTTICRSSTCRIYSCISEITFQPVYKHGKNYDAYFRNKPKNTKHFHALSNRTQIHVKSLQCLAEIVMIQNLHVHLHSWPHWDILNIDGLVQDYSLALSHRNNLNLTFVRTHPILFNFCLCPLFTMLVIWRA